MDKPIFSQRVSGCTRVYYIDIHTDKRDRPYMTISEIPTDKAPKGKKRQRVFVHAERMEEFAKAFETVARRINDMKPR